MTKTGAMNAAVTKTKGMCAIPGKSSVGAGKIKGGKNQSGKEGSTQIRWKSHRHWTEKLVAILTENEKWRLALFSGDSLTDAAEQDRKVKKNSLTSTMVLKLVCEQIFKDDDDMKGIYATSTTKFGPSLQNYLAMQVLLHFMIT